MPVSTQQRILSALWHVLACAAKKRANRDALEAGKETPVECWVTARIGRREVTEHVKGTLRVGVDAQTAGAADPEKYVVLAHVLNAVPKTRRAKLIEEIKELGTGKDLPEPPDAEVVGLAKQLLAELRASVTGVKRGAVSFQFE